MGEETIVPSDKPERHIDPTPKNSNTAKQCNPYQEFNQDFKNFNPDFNGNYCDMSNSMGMMSPEMMSPDMMNGNMNMSPDMMDPSMMNMNYNGYTGDNSYDSPAYDNPGFENQYDNSFDNSFDNNPYGNNPYVNQCGDHMGGDQMNYMNGMSNGMDYGMGGHCNQMGGQMDGQMGDCNQMGGPDCNQMGGQYSNTNAPHLYEDIRVREWAEGEHPLETEWTFWYDKKPTAKKDAKKDRKDKDKDKKDKDRKDKNDKESKRERKDSGKENNPKENSKSSRSPDQQHNNADLLDDDEGAHDDEELAAHPDAEERGNYIDNLSRLGDFNTVESFYRHYAYLKRPQDMPRDFNLWCFRKGYRPAWEEFPEGGCWIIRIKRKTGQNYVNRMWESLLMGTVGEAFGIPDVVGCVLSTRAKDDVLSLWNNSNENPQVRFRIGEKLREILDLDAHALIQYKEHMSSIQDNSTFRNAKNYIFVDPQ